MYTDAQRLDAFMSKFIVANAGYETDCWLWTASATRKGYGMVRTAEAVRPAHRVSYQLFVGPIPEGLQLDHLCRVRNCVNPEHLEPVTSAENSRRGLVNQNKQKTHCLCGREFDYFVTGYTGQTWRQCTACKIEAKRRFRQRRRAAS